MEELPRRVEEIFLDKTRAEDIKTPSIHYDRAAGTHGVIIPTLALENAIRLRPPDT
jgi:hypothetical protein